MSEKNRWSRATRSSPRRRLCLTGRRLGLSSDETVPEPPTAPERYRGEALQDFVDDVLEEPEPEPEREREEDLQDSVDDLLEEPERERDEGLQDFVDDLLKTLDE